MHPFNSTQPAALMALAMSRTAAFGTAAFGTAAFGTAAFDSAGGRAAELIGACGLAEAWRGTGTRRGSGCEHLVHEEQRAAGSRGKRRSPSPRLASRRIPRVSLLRCFPKPSFHKQGFHKQGFHKQGFHKQGFVISGVSPT